MKFQAAAILLLALLPGCGHAPSTAVQAPVAHVARAAAKAAPAKAEVAAPMKAQAAEVAQPVKAAEVAPLEAVTPAAQAPVAAPVAEEAKLTPAGEFVQLAAKLASAQPTHFHVTGSLTAEVDATVTAEGGTLVVTDSSVPAAKGQEVRWDRNAPMTLATSKGNFNLAPLLATLHTEGLLSQVATRVQAKEIVQRDGVDVAMFTITGSPYKVGFPVAGGATTYVEGADNLALVVSAN